MLRATDVAGAGRWEWLRRLGFGRRVTPCPVCGGLKCLCRPRYYSGQLLTETDLTAEQDYLLAKNRLHNRYLHGWGVVCGLDVNCHPDCAGWVRITQGYALDPCGNDVVVCGDVDLPVLDMINDCLRAASQDQPDCPPRLQGQVDCDPSGTWCLSVIYEETATRPMASLRRSGGRGQASCACGGAGPCAPSCGCGGSGAGGGCCGDGGSAGAGVSWASQAAGYDRVTGPGVAAPAGGVAYTGGTGNGNGNGNGRTATMAQTTTRGVPCEPTRWCEGYRFDLRRMPVDKGEHTWGEAFEGTLLGELLLCVLRLQDLDAEPQAGRVAIDRYNAYRSARADLERFLREHPTYRCALEDALGGEPTPPDSEIADQPPDSDLEKAQAWHASLDTRIAAFRSVVVTLLRECLCRNLLPPCPEDPGDQRVPLAAISVVDGRLDSICTFGCRKQLIGWPSVLWWLSALPIGPLIGQLLERLCCGQATPRELIGLLGARGVTSFVASNAGAEPVEMGQLAETLRILFGRS
jgi:hypothetical protein